MGRVLSGDQAVPLRVGEEASKRREVTLDRLHCEARSGVVLRGLDHLPKRTPPPTLVFGVESGKGAESVVEVAQVATGVSVHGKVAAHLLEHSEGGLVLAPR